MGIAQIAFAPPRTQTGTLGHFISEKVPQTIRAGVQTPPKSSKFVPKKLPQTIRARVETPRPLRAMPKCPQHEFQGGFPYIKVFSCRCCLHCRCLSLAPGGQFEKLFLLSDSPRLPTFTQYSFCNSGSTSSTSGDIIRNIRN